MKINTNCNGRSAVFCFLLLFMLLATQLWGQRKLGNEWIDYKQEYYKIKVTADGMYKVGYTELQNAGLTPESLNPHKLQLFFRGEQVPIRLSLQNGFSFQPGDFLEFWAQRNDGALDSVLYLDPKDQPHRDYSMYTDTAVYFLSLGSISGNNGLRAKQRAVPTTYHYPSQEWYMEESSQYFHETYWNGTPIFAQYNFIGSDYNEGEGWMSNMILSNGSTPGARNFTLATPSFTASGPVPEVEVLIYGKTDVSNVPKDHHLIIKVGKDQSSLRTVLDTQYAAFNKVQRTIKLNASDIGTNTVVNISSNNTTSDGQVVAYIVVRYPRKFEKTGTFSNQKFNFRNTSGDSLTHFEFSGTALGSQPPLAIYDRTNHIYSPVNYSGGSAHFLLPNNNKEAKLYLYNTAAVPALSLQRVYFNETDLSQNYNYLIVTHHSLANEAQQYVAFKDGQQVDSATTLKSLVKFTDQLYDEFYYGIHHPAAIQNFLAYMYQKAAEKPKYLLLLGKGYSVDIVRGRVDRDLVPVVGLPPSDLMYVVGIDNGFKNRESLITPPMSVGRVAAKSPEEALAYLEKLKVHKASQGAFWKKNILHVTGGETVEKQKANKQFMEDMAQTIEGPLTGADVKIFSVNNSDVIYKDFRQAIQNNLNNGSGMLTYMAHGSLNFLAIDIGEFEKLSNKGRYPIIYINGCNVGNIGLDYDPGTRVYSLGERYVLTPDKGAVAWLSHSNLTLEHVLPYQMDEFYKYTSGEGYGSTIGDVWRHVMEHMQSFNNSPEFRALSYELILQGDPAMPMPFIEKTDYSVTETKPFIAPEEALATDDSFSVAIPVRNLGRTDSMQIAVKVSHELPDGKEIEYDIQEFNPVYYSDTLFFKITRGQNKVQGVNKFTVVVDPDSLIIERTKENNITSFEYYFAGTGINTLYPLDFNIVPSDNPELMVQSRDIFDTLTGAWFEIDTTPHFNSPLLQSSDLIQGSNLIKWNPSLMVKEGGELKDSVVYFWRARLNLPTDSGGEWETKSFTYIKGSPEGWSQSHFAQYENSIVPTQMVLDTTERRFNFLPNYRWWTLNANYNYHSNMGIKADDGPQKTGGAKPGVKLMFMEVDRYTLDYYVDRKDSNRYSPLHIGGGQYIMFYRGYLQFDMHQKEERERFVQSVKEVREGNYVLLITRQDIAYSLFEPEVMDAFNHYLGAQLVDQIGYSETAYVLAAQKFNKGGIALAEDTAADYNGSKLEPDRSDVAEVRVLLGGSTPGPGAITSSLIGPASNWKSVYQDFQRVDTFGGDKQYLMVYGVDRAGKDTLLADSVTSSTLDISHIDAGTYPYLKLEAYLEDSAARTPDQLKMWQVLYDGIPEGTLVYDSTYAFKSDTVDQGDSVLVNVRYTNISKYPMKEMLVTFNITDESLSTGYKDSSYYPALGPGASFVIEKKISTASMLGLNKLTIYVNPDKEQPEMALENNILRLPFFVRQDVMNPLLDVTFDSRHILNMDIVSSSPEIVVNVRDENTALLLDDTSRFVLTLTRPDATRPDTLAFSDPAMSFDPATNGENVANVTYHPEHLSAGTYLFTAQAVDRKNNPAGKQPYRVYFRVIEDMAVSNMYVYPNPMSNTGRFVFTLTGPELPSEILIEVFDQKGTLVSRISRNRLQGLHIGTNTMEWAAADDEGHLLSNGLYMYRMTVKHNGNDVEHYNLPEDYRMQDAFGKIMIIRE